MKRTKQITTLARAAVVETVVVTVCDLCEAERRWCYRCKVCNRDACPGCCVGDPDDVGVHLYKICSHCEELYGKYKQQVVETEKAQKAAEDKIRAVWKAESLGK